MSNEQKSDLKAELLGVGIVLIICIFDLVLISQILAMIILVLLVNATGSNTLVDRYLTKDKECIPFALDIFFWCVVCVLPLLSHLYLLASMVIWAASTDIIARRKARKIIASGPTS